MEKGTEKRSIPFIRKLCAHLSEEEIEAAEERFRQYIRIGLEILREKDALDSEATNQNIARPGKKSINNIGEDFKKESNS